MTYLLLLLPKICHQHPRHHLVHQLAPLAFLSPFWTHQLHLISVNFLLLGPLPLPNLSLTDPLHPSILIIFGHILLQALHIALFSWCFFSLIFFNFLKHYVNLLCITHALPQVKPGGRKVRPKIELIHFLFDGKALLVFAIVLSHVEGPGALLKG
jgi:hypothetical protein